MKIRLTKLNCEKSYPGKRAAVICTQGCNLKCNYCFCSDLIAYQELGREDFEMVYDELKALVPEIDAVVITGGEPTIHHGLLDCLKKIKGLGLCVKLETNGTHPEILRQAIQYGLVDSISMDVKATSENYATVAGVQVDTEAIKNSIWIVKSSGIDHQFTTTLVPGFHTIRELRKIAGMIRGAKRFIVRDFVSNDAFKPELRGRAAFPHKPIESVRHLIERKVEHFEIQSNDEAIVMFIPGRRKRRRKSDIEKDLVLA